MELDPYDEGIRRNLEWVMSRLGKEERITLGREIGVPVSEDGKAAEVEVDEESFYWKE